MLNKLKELNKSIEVFDVNSKEFETFGRVINNIDPTEIIKVAKTIEMPEGSAYKPSVEAFESLEIATIIENEGFGTLPTQIGYCWGHNNYMNATEWHTSSEINVAVTPIVLILGRLQDVVDNKIDSSLFKAFYLPAGTVVEVYATSLHYCPCEVQKEGFGCVVCLPQNTNTELTITPENKLLRNKNKWLIAHNDNKALIEKGVIAGISGVNHKIKYCDDME